MKCLDEDNKLMSLAAKGDKEAYNNIVIKYRMSAISFAYCFLKDFFLAEDIIQDVFVSIYINRNKYKPIFTFRAYLYKIIKNRCIDYIRRNKNYVFNDIDFYEFEEKCKTEEIILYKEKINVVYNIINSLQNNHRTALYLFSIESMSYKEISIVMRITVTQVKILIFRARRRLKNMMEKEYGYEE